MNPFIKTALNFIVAPFVEKKLHEYNSTNEYDAPRPHPAQPSTQVAKLALVPSIATLIQVESVEATVASIAVLLVNLFFLYKPAKK